jgi:hypothetical protein
MSDPEILDGTDLRNKRHNSIQKIKKKKKTLEGE